MCGRVMLATVALAGDQRENEKVVDGLRTRELANLLSLNCKGFREYQAVGMTH
jgi:hypothetical protein